ncbi:hypothetical protein [Streptomyces sp. NPDC007088]|uniref:hypothetical protein n=1 Tax=Streptomyces sp. NPDC007088 TaxID=3364773 RepID=UPI00367FE071
MTYADHVVAVTPVSEREIAPIASEIERGEGLIQREVTLKVTGVLWSRPGSTAPKSFPWVASGWQFTDGSTADRTETAAREDSRIESGHTY